MVCRSRVWRRVTVCAPVRLPEWGAAGEGGVAGSQNEPENEINKKRCCVCCVYHCNVSVFMCSVCRGGALRWKQTSA